MIPLNVYVIFFRTHKIQVNRNYFRGRVYFVKFIFTLLFLMPFVDSRHLWSTFLLSAFGFFTLNFLLSTLNFYSRLSTFTLNS